MNLFFWYFFAFGAVFFVEIFIQVKNLANMLNKKIK